MSELKIRPLSDRVVVSRIVENVSPGGIVIPETAGEKPQRGKVLAVGPGKYSDGSLRKVDLKVGDEVLFGKYSGTEVRVGGQDVVVMREEDILGVFEH